MDLFHIYKPPSSLRSANQMILDIPRTRLKLSGDWAFAVAAPKHWNKLPLRLRLAPSLGYFKWKLKVHLLELAFGSADWLDRASFFITFIVVGHCLSVSYYCAFYLEIVQHIGQCYAVLIVLRFHLPHKQSKERWLRMMANDLQILSTTDKHLIL